MQVRYQAAPYGDKNLVEDNGDEPLAFCRLANALPTELIPQKNWSEMKDSNLRSSGPKPDGLTRLSQSPKNLVGEGRTRTYYKATKAA